jgi:polysaccharide chain length determinant protein (PEP-CTERM system associated)
MNASQPQQPDYKQYLNLIVRKKEWFVGISLLIMTLAIMISFILPRKYQASSTIFIEKNVISELVKGITVSPSMEDTIKVLTYAITSRTLLTKVVDNLEMNLQHGSKASNDEIVKDLQKRIEVSVKDKGSLFIISFSDSNPRIARDVVNTLVRLYIEENLSSKRGESYEATSFLSEQIGTFKEKLDKAETAVNQYKSEKGGIIAIDEAKLFEGISLAQQKLHELEIQRRQLEATRQDLAKGNAPLRGTLSALQKQLEELQAKYTDSYPEIIRVKAEIESLKSQISNSKGQTISTPELTRVEAQINALRASEESLRRYIGTNQATLRNIPSAKAGLEQLQIEKENQKNLYNALVARHGQSEVGKQMEVQDKSMTFRVVDPAILPAKPASPNRLMIMLGGIVAGLGGAFGILFLLDSMNSSLKSSDAARQFGLPVLAVIPKIDEPALIARQRKRNLRLFAVAGIYFLLLLCFPLMELLQVPYMDKILDRITAAAVVPQGGQPSAGYSVAGVEGFQA